MKRIIAKICIMVMVINIGSNIAYASSKDESFDLSAGEPRIEQTIGGRTKFSDSTEIDTTEAETEFSLKFLEKLPKKGENGFEEFTSIQGKDSLNEHEKKVYEEIEKVVNEIVKKVDEKPSDSKHSNLSREMRIAKAIYSWVVNNIKFNRECGLQSIIHVFEIQSGVCRDYAGLTCLMMRIANIPSISINSTRGQSSDVTHVFNAAYFESEDKNRTGWTVLDSTWAEPEPYPNDDCKYFENSLFDTQKTNLKDDIIENLDEGFMWHLANLNTEIDKKWRYLIDIKYMLRGTIERYKDDIENNIDNINKEIYNGLNTINLYSGIDTVLFQEIKIKIGSEEQAFSQDPKDHVFSKLRINASVSISDDYMKKKIEEVGERNKRVIHEYFPAFYNESMSFEEANRTIIKRESHKIKGISKILSINDVKWDYDTDIGKFIEEGRVHYNLNGRETKAIISLYGSTRNPVENVIIPQELLDLGLAFKIETGIKSLILQGDEKIDANTEFAVHLETVDTSKSSRYISDDGILYEKDENGQKGDLYGVFVTNRRIGEIRYSIRMDEHGKIEKIWICGCGDTPIDIEKLPEEITKYNVPIDVSDGIRSFKVSGDETIILCGTDIEKIDVTDSNKHIVDDGVLYEKDKNGNKGAQIIEFNKELHIGSFKYFIKPDCILLCGNDETPLKDVRISDELLLQDKFIYIGSGIESLILVGNQKVGFRKAKDLKKVDISESDIYVGYRGKLCTRVRFSPCPTDLLREIEIISSDSNLV